MTFSPFCNQVHPGMTCDEYDQSRPAISGPQDSPSEATVRPSEANSSQGDSQTRPVNILIVYNQEDATVICRDCDKALTSFLALLSHRCYPPNTVQPHPGQ